MSEHCIDFTFRKEGELIPEGVSVTETPLTYWVRFHDKIWGTRVVKLAKRGSKEVPIETWHQPRERNLEAEKAHDDFMADYQGGWLWTCL